MLIITAVLLTAGTSYAQTDSTAKVTDTVKVGNFIIIKKNKTSEPAYRENNNDINITYQVERRPAKKKNAEAAGRIRGAERDGPGAAPGASGRDRTSGGLPSLVVLPVPGAEPSRETRLIRLIDCWRRFP